MPTWLPRWFACLVLVLPFVPVVAGDADDKEIERLTKQLGSNRFRQREEATKRLTEIGEPALDAVTKAVTSSDPEVRRRAEGIISAIEYRLSHESRAIAHASGTFSLSADGKCLLTMGDDANSLRLWDASTGKCLRVFEGHTGIVHGLALSADGSRALSASEDHTVRLWDAETGKELRKYEGHATAVRSVAFGPEGQAISGDALGQMHLWDLKAGKKAGAFACHSHPRGIDATSDLVGGIYVTTVAYSARARLAVTSGHGDGSIRLWNLEAGKMVRKLHVADGSGVCVCFSPDGKRVAACFNTLFRIWDIETGQVVLAIPPSSAIDYPRCVAYSTDGKRIVTGSAGTNSLRVWDARSGRELRKYEGTLAPNGLYALGTVDSVAFFPDGKHIASACNDGTIRNGFSVRMWRAPR